MSQKITVPATAAALLWMRALIYYIRLSRRKSCFSTAKGGRIGKVGLVYLPLIEFRIKFDREADLLKLELINSNPKFLKRSRIFHCFSIACDEKWKNDTVYISA